MTDLELAREWWGNLSPDEIGNVQALTVLLARVRLDEAKFFYDALKSETELELPFWLAEKFSKRVTALEQAWLERHRKDADLLVYDTRAETCTEAIYYSPMKKANDDRDRELKRFFELVREERIRQGDWKWED